MKPQRSARILLTLTALAGFTLAGCQALPPQSLAHAVDRSNEFMRSSGHSPREYYVPNAYYRLEENGWLVIYRSVRSGYVGNFTYVFVPNDGPAQFTPDMPRPAIDYGYYNHP